MASVTKEFSALGASDQLYVNHGDTIDYTVALSEGGSTFDGTFVLERSVSGAAWEPVVRLTAASTGSVICEHKTPTAMKYRWSCYAFGGGGDPVTVTVAESGAIKIDVVGPNGTVAVRYSETGVEVPGTLDVDGAADFDSTIDVAGAATFGSTLKVTGATASNVTKLRLDASGNALEARCTIANIPTGAGYAKGCILIATDGTNHTDTVYFNIGNATTANFNAATIAADA